MNVPIDGSKSEKPWDIFSKVVASVSNIIASIRYIQLIIFSFQYNLVSQLPPALLKSDVYHEFFGDIHK